MSWIHQILAYSNLLGYLPCYFLWQCDGQEYRAMLMIVTVMMSSSLMHLSETKHGLIPATRFLYDWSGFLLNLDRFCAIVATIYFGFRAWECRFICPMSAQITLFIVACTVNFLGEQASNQKIYCFTHLMWHIMIYMHLALLSTFIWIMNQAAQDQRVDLQT